MQYMLKFIYYEKAATLLLSEKYYNKSKVEFSQNFVTFSEYMNFNLDFGGFCQLVRVCIAAVATAVADAAVDVAVVGAPAPPLSSLAVSAART